MTRSPRGLGMWIWKIADCEGGDPGNIVWRCGQAGLRHVCLKFADGRNPFQHDALRKLIPALKAAGIEPWLWPFIYAWDGQLSTAIEEAEVEAAWFRELGGAGFIIDAETGDGSKYGNRPDLARAYARALRAELPDTPLGLSSYWKPSYHSELPFDEFMAVCDFAAPQVYWNGADPVSELQTCLHEYARWGKPVIPTGGDLNESPRTSPAEIAAFAARCLQLGLPALSFWCWDEADADQWSAVAAIQWKEANPMPRPVVTSQDIAAVALEVAQYRLAHPSEESCVLHGRTFDLVDAGRCGYFVVDSVIAAGNAAGVDLTDLPWYAANTRESNDKLAQFAASGRYGIRNVSIDDATPGCVVAFTTPGVGHIALYVGLVDGVRTVAENTSSSRGQGHPGTGLTAWADLASTVEALYQVFPDASAPSGELKVIYPADQAHASVVPCNPVEQNGVTRVDLAAVCQALGFTPFYRDTPDGPRIYIKPKPSP